MPDSSISLETRIVDLPNQGFGRLGLLTARKLATGVAQISSGRNIDEVTVEDLLLCLPMRYEDRSKLILIRNLSDGMEASLELFVKHSNGKQIGGWRRSFKHRLYKFNVFAADRERTGKVVIETFVSGLSATRIIESYEKKFAPGTRLIAFGKWSYEGPFQYVLRLNRPDEIEVLPPLEEKLPNADGSDENDDVHSAIHVGRRVPVYRKINELRPKQLREIVHDLLKEIPRSAIAETLPVELRKRQSLIDRAEALNQIHFPADDSSLAEYEAARSPAHRRLIFEEFFWLTLGLAVKRGRRIKESKGEPVTIDDGVKRRIASVLPFKLTEAQRRVVKEIFRDMKSDAPMNRLLQGDVGSGKTIVAVIAMLAAMENGRQTALMVPTEILAEQHARNIKRILAASPFRVELLTGSTKSTEKKLLREAIAAGEVNAVIGTHALIQVKISFKHLGLAVIDEQHRFGVMQRAELRARGVNPDVLVMTATPIPRSLAMTVYGDLDVSIIDQMPPGRTPIVTRVFADNTDDRNLVKQLLRDEMLAGRQVYVVYPLVEESEKMDLRDATRRFEYLRDKVFPKFSVGLLHGRMKADEKDEVMRRFVSGEIQILVSTTVIEVGVDVPNASVMVIEHAERFGLSQLHQLRGRVGRGARQSYCVLLASDKQTEVARERLGIMEETTDGFKIAEKDLELRGPGEIMGTRQAGLPEFRIANLVRDLDILQAARTEAEFYFNQRVKSREVAAMIERLRHDTRMKLAAVG